MIAVNEGGADRAIRAVLGVVALLAAFLLLGAAGGSVAGIAVAVVGGILLATGVIGFCPAYVVCGLRTCKPKA
ncbi:MAG: DUF2892 domain-containing protein [Planctomycetota bacterium]